jgi:hypothetical protein
LIFDKYAKSTKWGKNILLYKCFWRIELGVYIASYIKINSK